ncbi:MAG: hypothetical protein KA151_11865 [Piscinibacter sp.]|nr:hypothetical protein [Piscinibacter sp.]
MPLAHRCTLVLVNPFAAGSRARALVMPIGMARAWRIAVRPAALRAVRGARAGRRQRLSAARLAP